MNIALEFMKYAGLAILPFSLYFAWLRVGSDVSARCTWSFDRIRASGIGEVTLVNMKDKSIPIFSIQAVRDGAMFELSEFSPPLILKPFEATIVVADEVSNWYVGDAKYDFMEDLSGCENVSIYIFSSNRRIKCKVSKIPSPIIFAKKHNISIAYKCVDKFNGIVYNENALYALTYRDDGLDKTAIVDKSGYINWGMLPNLIPESELSSADAVKAALMLSGVEKVIGKFYVDALHEHRLRN